MEQTFKHIQHFAQHHDELPAFHAGYLALALITAAMLNYGVFALLIGAHMALDVYKYRVVHSLPWLEVIEGVVRESLLDITLLLLGLVFAVYLHNHLAIAGMSGFIRAELTIVRAFGTLLPKLLILNNVLKVATHLHHYLHHKHPHLRKPWQPIELLCFAFMLIALFLLAFAPSLLQFDSHIVLHILEYKLNPFNL